MNQQIEQEELRIRELSITWVGLNKEAELAKKHLSSLMNNIDIGIQTKLTHYLLNPSIEIDIEIFNEAGDEIYKSLMAVRDADSNLNVKGTELARVIAYINILKTHNDIIKPSDDFGGLTTRGTIRHRTISNQVN